MQDFRMYNYDISVARLAEIQKEYDGDILVIINGEYYNLVKDTEKPEKEVSEVF